jgi:hypothetical protein
MCSALENAGKTSTLVLVVLLGLALGFSMLACGDDDSDGGTDGGSDSDTDTDTDTDTDSDADPNCFECDGPLCISMISGQILRDDGSPVTGESFLKFCMPGCHYIDVDGEGYFEFIPTDGCSAYDVEAAGPIYIEVAAELEDGYTHHIMAMTPTQEQISDQSSEDTVFDLGVHYLYELPAEKVAYTASGGATVDLSGVQFDVAPGELGEADIELGVFKFPIDEWVPPFIGNPYHTSTVPSVDALYFLIPYWSQVATGDGVVLSITPPDGWTDGDPGKIYVLGDWYDYFMEYPGGEDVPRGELVEWSDVIWEGGRVVTAPIPVLSWVALVKD